MVTLKNSRNPWAWIPTLYFAEGLPNVIVTALSVVMYMQLGLTDAEVGLYTGWLALPWVIKPLWSPFIDLLKTKRWWVLTMQALIGAALAGIAFSLPTAFWFQTTMCFFFLIAFCSATHDISADGFYMIELDEHTQTKFVGLRNTFYRLAIIFVNGFLVMLAGVLQVLFRNQIRFSWALIFYGLAGIFIGLWLYHSRFMPRPKEDVQNSGIRGYFLLVGIDDLRKINIKYGWDYGNRIIMHVAETLSELSQGKYGVYRMDGDCLAVRLVNATKEETQNFFDEAQKLLSLTCTISGGSAEFKNKKGEAENAYQYAEEALSKSKKVSKAMLQFFSEEDYKKKIADTLLLDELNQSVQNGFRGFSLCYQPQIKSSVYDLFGAEALLRYNSPSAGKQMPDRFIPMLENSGLIYPVGLWVLETALKQCAVWRKNSPKFHISVNVSYVQLKNSHITRDVLDKLYASGLPGSALTIEITETISLKCS